MPGHSQTLEEDAAMEEEGKARLRGWEDVGREDLHALILELRGCPLEELEPRLAWLQNNKEETGVAHP